MTTTYYVTIGDSAVPVGDAADAEYLSRECGCRVRAVTGADR